MLFNEFNMEGCLKVRHEEGIFFIAIVILPINACSRLGKEYTARSISN